MTYQHPAKVYDKRDRDKDMYLTDLLFSEFLLSDYIHVKKSQPIHKSGVINVDCFLVSCTRKCCTFPASLEGSFSNS